MFSTFNKSRSFNFNLHSKIVKLIVCCLVTVSPFCESMYLNKMEFYQKWLKKKRRQFSKNNISKLEGLGNFKPEKGFFPVQQLCRDIHIYVCTHLLTQDTVLLSMSVNVAVINAEFTVNPLSLLCLSLSVLRLVPCLWLCVSSLTCL